jgi:hypothetical protein
VHADADAASQRRLNMAFRACLRLIYSLRRLDHVFHLGTSVMGASLADYYLFIYRLSTDLCLTDNFSDT